MSGKRKCWTPSEEDRFLRIWYSNLDEFHSGKKRSEIYKELEVEFINQGIDVSAAHIKAKMESFKRKYSQIKKKKSRKQWKNFDLMVAIMKHKDEIKESKYDQPEENTDETFSSVYVDDVSPMLFNEEEHSQNEDDDIKTTTSSTMSADAVFPKKSKQRSTKADSANNLDPSIANTAFEKPKQRRKFWVLQEEELFLDVWEKYVRDLRGDKKKSHVYKDMESEFHSQGIEMRCSDVKAKIESFTRKFRKERDSLGSTSEWIHYSKVADLLGALEATKFDQFSDNSASSSYIEDTTSWFNEDMPIYPTTCLERSSVDGIEDEPSLKRAKSNANSSFDHTDNAQDGTQVLSPRSERKHALLPDELELGLLEDNSMEQLNLEQEYSNQTARHPELSKQFGQFVTKELNMLSDDLLIEAKRRIYNVICIMQMKQVRLNKTIN